MDLWIKGVLICLFALINPKSFMQTVCEMCGSRFSGVDLSPDTLFGASVRTSQSPSPRPAPRALQPSCFKNRRSRFGLQSLGCCTLARKPCATPRCRNFGFFLLNKDMGSLSGICSSGCVFCVAVEDGKVYASATFQGWVPQSEVGMLVLTVSWRESLQIRVSGQQAHIERKTTVP